MAQLCLLALPLLLLGPAGQAATPRVLEIIPKAGPLAVVAVDHLERSDARLRELLASVDGTAYAGIGPLLETMGVRAGIDLTGSAAAMVMPAPPDREGGPAGRLLLLLPISDADAFFKGVNARTDGNLKTFDYLSIGYFARAITPRYVALGEDRSLVESYALPANGSALSRVDEFGAVGSAIAEHSDVIAITTPTDFLILLKAIESVVLNPHGVNSAPKRTIDNREGPGMQLEGALPDGYFPDRLLRLLKSESRSVLLTAAFEPGALRIECASTFADDSVLKRAARSPAEAGAPADSPLATMPAQPYLLAMGIDAAHPGVRILADELGPPGRSTKVFVQLELAILGAIPSLEALSLVVYEPASVMFGSLARTLISWRAPAPEEGVRAFRQWVESLDQRPMDDKAFASKYEPGADVDLWSITPPAGAYPMVPMLLGPFPELQGKLVTTPERAYLTWSRDAALIDRAAKAGLNGEPTLSRDERLAQVASMLPSPRIMEVYFDTAPIIKQIGPMMAGKHAAGELPARLSPLGAAVAVDDGVARLSIVAPADLLKAWRTLSQPDTDGAPSRPDRPAKKE